MILKKLRLTKSIISILFFSLLALSFFVFDGPSIFQSQRSASAANSCGFNSLATGNFTINSNCAISSGVEGIDQGNITVSSGRTITIAPGAQLVISPGKEIYFAQDITSQLIVGKPSNPQGAVVKGSLCTVDADGDGYAVKVSPTSNQAEPYFSLARGATVCSNGTTRKGLLNSQTQLDCFDNDPTKYKQDCVLSAPNYTSGWTNIGTCGQYGVNLQSQQRTWTKTVVTAASECGGVACGPQAGTETQDISCTPAACTSGSCCDVPNGVYRPTSYSCSSTVCSANDYYYISGAASSSGTNYTYLRNYNPVTVYCDGAGNCNNYTCNSFADTLIGSCGTCKYASGDAAGCTNYNTSTSCSTSSCSSGDYYYISGVASPTGTNYTYIRNYSNVTTYCNGSGSCNNYTCGPFVDTLVASCGTCQYASGNSSGCTNYVAATACGTTACAADYYNLSGNTCYFNDYPATAGNTCNGSGVCNNGTCSATQSTQATAGACQSITGCTGSTPGTVIGTQYLSVAKSAANFTRNNCAACQTGNTPTYTVAAGTYSSCVSQADADSKAQAAANAANTQAWANANGTCTGGQFWNTAQSAANYTKNNCALCTTGTTPTYTVAANTISSCVSVADANSQAQTAATAGDTQAWANSAGTCTNQNTSTSCGTTSCSSNDYYYVSGAGSPTGTNYTYIRNYSNVTTYCNGSGSCNNYTCAPYVDNLYASCGLCQQAVANSSGCSNYASATVCGTTGCAADYYNLSGSTCYFNDYPATVNNTCNGSGTCNAGTCSAAQSTYLTTANSCQSISGCTGATPGSLNGTQYWNVVQSVSLYSRNNCAACQTGSTPTYTVGANSYSSCTSQAAANTLAYNAAVTGDTQAWANTTGTCSGGQFLNVAKSAANYTKNNCALCTTGTTPTYTVSAGTYSSCVSQADADTQAQNAANAGNTQAWANGAGSCTNQNTSTTCSTASCSSLDYYWISGAASPTGTNYTYLRNHNNTTVYCNGSGTCNNYTCTVNVNYADNLVASCGSCVYASGNSSGCTSYGSGTVCGTTGCASDYYSYSNPTCYFYDYPATVNNTCNGSGTCNAGTCSATQSAQSSIGACQSMSGCTGSTPGTPTGTQYWSVAKSAANYTRNNCGACQTGSTPTYTVAANSYSSCVSQADANTQAQNAANAANTQAWANANGTCSGGQFLNVAKSAANYTKNNCALCTTGTTPTYTVSAGTYPSCVSQADADTQAQNAANAGNTQAWANGAGSCTNQNTSTTCSTASCSSLDYYWISGAASPTGTNYTYLRNHNNVTVYCNGSGTCNNYTCTVNVNYADNLVASCGSCVYASGNSSGCTSYGSGTVCGTTGCASDYYSYSNPTCYFYDYPATVNNTCNGSGTCNAGTCSATQSAQSSIGACQSMSGCTGSTPGTPTGTQYWNTAQSAALVARNNCSTCYSGSTPTYTVAANSYSSCTSQAAANTLAYNAAVAGDTQAWANANGSCSGAIYYNTARSAANYTKNNCALCTTGTTPTYTVAAGTCYSCSSQADADNQCQVIANNTNTQAWANTNGTCTNQNTSTTCSTASCSYLDYYFISGAASPTGTNYTYIRNHNNTTVYCNGSGSCNNYTCTVNANYADNWVASCGSCVYASGNSSGCTSYGSGTVCGTTGCPGTYYNLSGGSCYINTYPGSVNNTCNGSGTCNAGSCSSSQALYLSPANECQSVTGCSGATPGTLVGTKYWSAAKSAANFAKSDCSTCYSGSTPTYTVGVNSYTSCISQADADSKAQAAANAGDTQAWANANGSCSGAIYWNTARSAANYTRNNCALCYAGTTPTYTAPAGTCYSCSSQADADNQCQVIANNINTQSWANNNGGCNAQTGNWCGTTSCSGNNYTYVSGGASPSGTNYVYRRSYSDVNVYCSAGSCNNYTCNVYGDGQIYACGTCIYAWASGNTGGCSNYGAGTVCNSTICQSDYYYLSGSTCYFYDYPSSVNHTCDGGSTCNAGTCSATQSVNVTAGACQWITGCSGLTSGTVNGAQYWNDAQSVANVQRINCGTCQTGSWPTYTVGINSYSSCTSKADANNQAYNAAVAGDTQAWANANGSCSGGQYWNTVAGAAANYTRNNCPLCYAGTTPTCTYAVGSVYSCSSNADANNQAQALATACSTQAWANDNGGCNAQTGPWCGTTSCSGNNSTYVSGAASPSGTNYVYRRSYSDVNVYCNAGSCNSYSCNAYGDGQIAACGTCVYAWASNNSGGCYSYGSGTVCGTTGCASDYYSLSGNTCYFYDYPASVNNTCDGGSTCNAGTCSPSTSPVIFYPNACQSVGGCSGGTAGYLVGTQYWNTAQSVANYAKSNCGTCQTGSIPTYTVGAGSYYSCSSQADANNKAYNAAVAGDTQAWANDNGSCSGTAYWSSERSAANYTRNNCATCTAGTTPTLTVAAGTCYSCSSQADADNQCQTIANNNNTQTWANNNGGCNNQGTGTWCGNFGCSGNDYCWGSGQTVYVRNYWNVNVYCNGSGSCNSPSCGPYTDNYVTTCNSCQYTSGCSCGNQGAGYGCGSTGCAADYYYLSGSTCYFYDYPASVGNTCNGAGTCNAGTCSATQSTAATAGACQWITGCSGSTGPTVNGAQYWNSAQSVANYQRNNCAECQTGSWPTYVVGGSSYSSCSSQADANNQAYNAAVAGNTQAWANDNGTCSGSTAKEWFYRDADGDGYGYSNDSTYACSNSSVSGYVKNYYDCNDGDYWTTVSASKPHNPATCGTGSCAANWGNDSCSYGTWTAGTCTQGSPATCSSLGYNCGTWSDGCGGIISCGSCSIAGQTCQSGRCVAFRCGMDVVDESGNSYNTVQIGTQCWTQQNMNTGVMINTATAQTNNGVVEKYCYGNSSANCTTYGGMYSLAEALKYNALAPRGICPLGFHVATFGDFNILESYVGASYAGQRLKAVGQGNGNDMYSFRGLLAGQCTGGYCSALGASNGTAYWWSANASYCIRIAEAYGVTLGGMCGTSASSGVSVRCVEGASGCVPDCTAKTCGSDGCGGDCGTCPSPKVCNGSSCVCAQCENPGTCGTVGACTCNGCTPKTECCYQPDAGAFGTCINSMDERCGGAIKL